MQREARSQFDEPFLDELVDLGQSNYLTLSNKNISQQTKFIHPKGRIFTAQLSNNKRFISIGGTKQKLEIWSSRRSKIIKTIKFERRVMESIFSSNDEFIYIALPTQLIIFSMVKRFKQVNSCSMKKSYIPNIYIKQLKELENNLILFCYGFKLYKYDHIKNQLLTILSQVDIIYSFDYISDQKELVCSSKLQQLSLFINNKLLIQQKIDQINNIFNVRFFNNSYILGSINGNLVIWDIDHNKKEFIQKINILKHYVEFQLNLDLAPRYIIFFFQNIPYTYKLQKGNQIDEKELSLLQLIGICSKHNHFPQEPYIINKIK